MRIFPTLQIPSALLAAVQSIPATFLLNSSHSLSIIPSAWTLFLSLHSLWRGTCFRYCDPYQYFLLLLLLPLQCNHGRDYTVAGQKGMPSSTDARKYSDFVVPKYKRTRVVQHVNGEWRCSCMKWQEVGVCCRHIYAVTGRHPSVTDTDIRWRTEYVLGYKANKDFFEGLHGRFPSCGPKGVLCCDGEKKVLYSQEAFPFEDTPCVVTEGTYWGLKTGNTTTDNVEIQDDGSMGFLVDNSPRPSGLLQEYHAAGDSTGPPPPTPNTNQNMEDYTLALSMARNTPQRSLVHRAVAQALKPIIEQGFSSLPGIARFRSEAAAGAMVSLPTDSRDTSTRRALSYREGREPTRRKSKRLLLRKDGSFHKDK